MSTTFDPPLARLDAVTTPQQEEHYAAAAAAVRAKIVKRERTSLLKTVGLCLAIPAIASGWVYRQMRPVVQHEVRFIPMMPDGTIVNSVRWEYLPLRDRNVVILNTVWNYVRMRESFSRIGAGYAWNAVVAMSSPDVIAEYERTNDPKLPTSQWARYDERARVDVSRTHHRFLCAGTNCGPEDEPIGMEIQFRRQEVIAGIPQPVSIYMTEIRFDRNVPGLDPDLIASVNGAALRVTYYRPGQPVGGQGGR